MPRWTRALGLSTGLLLTGCGSDRAPDGKAAVKPEATASDPADTVASLPSWSAVPAPADPSWLKLERSRDPGIVRAWDELGQASNVRAAWALARVGGVTARDRLLPEIGRAESNPAVVGAVSFLEPPSSAPGEPPDPTQGWAELEDALWTRYAVTDDDAAATAILLAVARVGGPRSMQRLAADTEVLPSRSQQPRYRAAFEATGILCARGFSMTRAALESAASGLQSDASNVRAAAAYALGRCAAPSAEQIAGEERARLVELLLPLLSQGDADVRRLAYRALGGLGEVPAQIDVEVLAASTSMPWLVETEAVRALVVHADGRQTVSKRLAELPASSIDDTRVHAVLTAVSGLRSAVAGNAEILGRLKALEKTVRSAASVATGRSRKRLALVQCELAVAIAVADGDIDQVDRCAAGIDELPPWYGRTLGVEALLSAGAALPRAEKLTALLARAEDASPQVAGRALSALADVDDDRVSAVLRRALMHEDVGIVAAAASAIAARSVDASRRDPSAAEPLRDAVQRLDNARAVEARVAAVEALGSLARSATKPQEVEATTVWLEQVVVPLASDDNAAIRASARQALLGKPALVQRFDQARPALSALHPKVAAAMEAQANAPRGIRLQTSAGEIEIDFTGAPAPLAQAVIAQLSATGFYNGLTVHRVVPGFVVQGGDPHGDGYGGPGFIVPCERSTLRYERGTVGIALAGKDTGGSQFFVTQSRQPHLDARYTVVGRVSVGMDVVDRLLPHDRIVKASLL